MKLWIAGVWLNGGFEFLGVFDDEAKAAAACTARNHSYAPALLNQRAPEVPTHWEGLRYPIAEAESLMPSTFNEQPSTLP